MLNTILQGDVIEVLKTMPDNYVNCCVTSPPYWGLRDYGTDKIIFDGDVNCEHDWRIVHKKPIGGKNHKDRPPNTGSKNSINKMDVRGKGTYSDFCNKCDAWRGQLGLEPTPELYVKHMTDVFNQVKRVLKPDGTLWLNLGDSYWGGKGQSGSAISSRQKERFANGESINAEYQCIGQHGETIGKDGKHEFIKPKDLIGIPWMVAFALRAAGWYLRSDIIWHKPNPMPESVTDRPTKSHEYIFLMSKSSKYYYDYEAIQEKAVTQTNGKPAKNTFGSRNGELNRLHSGKQWIPKNLQADGQQPNTIHLNRLNGNSDENYTARNKRSVWTVNLSPYPDAHFATFPQELIIDCIKAGCPEGGIVLDPFGGAGTTMIVARKLKRNAILIELNEKYIKIANKRIEKELGLIFE